MATRSIYRKICPSCSASVETDAKQCDCGYSFLDTLLGEDAPRTEDQALREEELLKEYLDARIEQSVSELETLRESMASDPKNLDKANNVLRAFAQVRELRSQRNVQLSKIDELRKIAGAAQVERGLAAELAEDLIKEISTAVASTAEPTDAFRATQAAKAESALKAAGINTKTCPKCRTVLPEVAGLCFCGYTFTQRNGSPNLQHTQATTRPGDAVKSDDFR